METSDTSLPFELASDVAELPLATQSTDSLVLGDEEMLLEDKLVKEFLQKDKPRKMQLPEASEPLKVLTTFEMLKQVCTGFTPTLHVDCFLHKLSCICTDCQRIRKYKALCRFLRHSKISECDAANMLTDLLLIASKLLTALKK